MKKSIFYLSLVIGLSACQSNSKVILPILGEKTIAGKDTLYKTIPNFKFLSQDSTWITEETVKNKIYVAEFFFTSCKSICPVMTRNLLTVYQQYKTMPNFVILSHTIDPKTDNVSHLKHYAQKLNVEEHSNWLFLTGSEDEIHTIAEESYMSAIRKPQTKDDELAHSGYFLLIDQQRRIRGAYDGTNEKAVAQLIKDIAILNQEMQ